MNHKLLFLIFTLNWITYEWQIYGPSNFRTLGSRKFAYHYSYIKKEEKLESITNQIKENIAENVFF